MTADLPPAAVRPRAGRWVGGVCLAVAARSGVPVARVRAAFVLAALVGGLGAVAYLAGWLILPAEGDDGGDAAGRRGIVVLAQACGALVGLGALAALAAAATVFGFGWVVVAAGGAILAGAILAWPRVGPGWTLLPIGALVLPSLAMAGGGLRIEPRSAPVTLAPRTFSELPAGGVRSGLGLLQVDLRRTALPRAGSLPLRIRAGVRRTLVALPHDRCVHVEVRQHPLPLAARAASLAVGAGPLDAPGVTVFGRTSHAERVTSRGAAPGPTLRIDFASAGGVLVVRDYPRSAVPEWMPDWPGYRGGVESRPDTSGLGRRAARHRLRAWRQRRARQLRSKRRIDRLMPGPCARRAPHRHAGDRHAGDRRDPPRTDGGRASRRERG